jgi:hypothetical protein
MPGFLGELARRREVRQSLPLHCGLLIRARHRSTSSMAGRLRKVRRHRHFPKSTGTPVRRRKVIAACKEMILVALRSRERARRLKPLPNTCWSAIEIEPFILPLPRRSPEASFSWRSTLSLAMADEGAAAGGMILM